MCTEVHRKEVKLNGAMDWGLVYHFIKGRGVWAPKDTKSWGRDQELYGGTREGQGFLISISVKSVYANSSLSWLSLSRDKNILLTHILRRHGMKLCPASRQIRGWQWTLLAYVDSKLPKAPKGHILGWHSLYPFIRHWRPWHNLWHTTVCNPRKWAPLVPYFKGLET